MKLVLFDDGRPGLLRSDRVVDISRVVSPLRAGNGQQVMKALITRMDDFRTEFSRLQ